MVLALHLNLVEQRRASGVLFKAHLLCHPISARPCVVAGYLITNERLRTPDKVPLFQNVLAAHMLSGSDLHVCPCRDAECLAK